MKYRDRSHQPKFFNYSLPLLSNPTHTIIMKKLLLLFIFISCNVFSQEFTLPEVKFHKDTLNSYARLLNLKDSHALILKVGYTNYWYGGTSSDFVVYNNDGTIEKYKTFLSFKAENTVKKIKVPKRKYVYYKQFITECVTDNLFDIDTTKLNIQTVTDENGITQSMTVHDATNISFELIKDNQYSKFESYAPELYIESKAIGYEEREKLVNLVNKFEAVIKK